MMLGRNSGSRRALPRPKIGSKVRRSSLIFSLLAATDLHATAAMESCIKARGPPWSSERDQQLEEILADPAKCVDLRLKDLDDGSEDWWEFWRARAVSDLPPREAGGAD